MSTGQSCKYSGLKLRNVDNSQIARFSVNARLAQELSRCLPITPQLFHEFILFFKIVGRRVLKVHLIQNKENVSKFVLPNFKWQ